MNLFRLRILTPEGLFFDDAVQRLVVRTCEGERGILARHENYAAALPSGLIRIAAEDGTVRRAALSEAMVKVSAAQTVILADTAAWAEDTAAVSAAPGTGK